MFFFRAFFIVSISCHFLFFQNFQCFLKETGVFSYFLKKKKLFISFFSDIFSFLTFFQKKIGRREGRGANPNPKLISSFWRGVTTPLPKPQTSLGFGERKLPTQTPPLLQTGVGGSMPKPPVDASRSPSQQRRLDGFEGGALVSAEVAPPGLRGPCDFGECWGGTWRKYTSLVGKHADHADTHTNNTPDKHNNNNRIW